MRALLASILLATLPATAMARSLHWAALEVDALLDAEAVLHVRERHVMVFDGDWNGGERIFDVRPGQSLKLTGVSRVDPETGQRIELQRGDLDRVDQWDWHSRHQLRWRSRLPSDPPFDEETLAYEIDYELQGILGRREDGYLLDHDFAFPDRVGWIERFALNLELDPAWRPPPGFQTELELANLAPGESVVVTGLLEYAGVEQPAAVRQVFPTTGVWALFAAVVALIALKAEGLRRREADQGRFEKPEVPRPIHRGWLRENLFDLLPEEAGALWDHKIGAPEVAAVIARMVAEGKLSSRVDEEGRWWKRPVMTLVLIVDRDELEGYERTLVDKLFFDGRETTDTRALRRHYKAKGFDPAAAISSAIHRRLRELPGGGSKLAPPRALPTLILFLASGGLLALEWWTRGPGAAGPLIAALAVLTPIPSFWAYLSAYRYRIRVGNPVLGWLGFLTPLAFVLLACLAIAWAGSQGRRILPDLEPGPFGMLALAAFALLIANSVLNQAQTRDRKAVILRRRALLEARRHLATELGKPIPDLEDAWFPYILAFGLSRRADAWTQSHGAETTRRGSATIIAGSGSSSGGWSGGGDLFGGAGAVSRWTEAATGMASGVPAPSSGGSGGGSSGGSSGGGGGGGW